MSIRETIKAMLAYSDFKLKDIASEMTKITGKKFTIANLSQKLIRGTLKYEEAKIIGEILGYDLEFVKRKK